MAAVFEEVELTWKGETYKVTPTMKMLNKIEQDVSLSSLAYRIGNNDVPVSLLATAIAAMLQYAGARATNEEVYMQLLNGDPDTVAGMAQAVILAAFPQPKKSEDQPAKATKPAARRK